MECKFEIWFLSHSSKSGSGNIWKEKIIDSTKNEPKKVIIN